MRSSTVCTARSCRAQGIQSAGLCPATGRRGLERRCSPQGLELVDAQPSEFLRQLAEALPTKPPAPAGMPQEPLKLLNRRPYLFLKFFELLDTEVFFGRETESLLLWRKILSYRLVVLFGTSGAGKSSLLNAGVWPKLTPYRYDVCDVRVGGDPVAAVRQAATGLASRRAGRGRAKPRDAGLVLPAGHDAGAAAGGVH